MLPRLELELLHPGAMRRRAGNVLLTVGGLLLTLALLHFAVYTRQITRLEQQSEGEGDTVAAVNQREISPEESQAVQHAIEQLALPWNNLYTALEHADVGKTLLISIEPDATSGSARIVAESPDAYQMLEYVRALQLQSELNDVALQDYELQGGNNDLHVRYTVAAGWRGKP